MGEKWYCRVAGEELGPISAKEVRRLVGVGVILRDSLLRKGTDGEWVRAEKIYGLFQQSNRRGFDFRV